MDSTAPSPLSTYRLQCHAGFTLDDARELLPYLDSLGVTHLYLSPVLHSRSGSTHGYDGVDPRAVDPSLGGRAALERLAEDAHRRDMGLLVDTVPNHLSTSMENPAWRDVLGHGRSSPWARWFDIDWDSPDEDLRGRVLCPILGAPPETAIANGELSVAWREGRFVLCYFEHQLPLSAASVSQITATAEDDPPGQQLAKVLATLARSPEPAACGDDPGSAFREAAEELLDQLAGLADTDPPVAAWLQQQAERFGAGPDGPARMRDLLDRQAYRLTAWQEAARRINYRRFFDINELVCLRQEDPRVFEETHATLLELAAAGFLDGLRIDHVDGLLDPLGYLRQLREALAVARPDRPFLLFVEKILAEGEKLPASWPVDGTTGYEFLNQVEHWLVSPPGFTAIEQFYQELTGRPEPFPAVAEKGKRRVLRKELHAPAEALARELAELARAEGHPLDPEAAHDAVVEVITALPVYRTYADEESTGLKAAQDQHVRDALDQAQRTGHTTPEALDFLGRLLRLDPSSGSPPEPWVAFVQRFQQLSGPAAAKGIEDTALYAYAPLASLNEVGGEPVLPEHDPGEALHRANRERAAAFPRAMLAVSTHDTKRSADVRARLDVLSEIPERWCEAVRRWRTLNAAHRRGGPEESSPGPAKEFLFYQSLLAIWPVHGGEGLPNDEELHKLEERLVPYMEKAAREAKRRTSWTSPDGQYEEALQSFVRAVLAPDNTPFLDEVHELATAIAPAGCWNALAQSVLHLSSPGSPDIYQGDELWDLSLVDPDNRRAVDFDRRATLLHEVHREAASGASGWLATLRTKPNEGRLKLHVVHALLRARRTWPDLFGSTDYRPLEVCGPQAAHLLAFLRVAGPDALLVVVSRHTLSLPGAPSEAPVGPACWQPETKIVLPEELRFERWESLLGSAETIAADASTLAAAALLADLPVAVCRSSSAGTDKA